MAAEAKVSCESRIADSLTVVERVPGDAGTEFGVPGIVPDIAVCRVDAPFAPLPQAAQIRRAYLHRAPQGVSIAHS